MTTSTDDRNFRLPPHVRPVRYETVLHLRPLEKRFSGTMRLEVSCEKDTSHVVLHAVGLTLSKVRALVSGQTQPARECVEKKESETVVLRFSPPLPEGAVTLLFDWEGAYQNGLRGLYASGPVTATQFEAAEARRCFPCFDEPAFKARWKISVRAPRDFVTLSNGREVSKEVLGDEGITHFEETERLSSYLLAVACGPLAGCALETVDGIPLRTWGTVEKAHLTGFGQQVAKAVLPMLRGYFGLPYGFGKIDQVAVPDFEAGAMENAGLVLYREILLLLDEKKAPLAVQKRVAEVITHELAHQWFGNWVTMVWWEDLWLNEAFATWMAYKIVDEWKPHWRLWADFDAGKAQALALDALESTHPIRTEVRNAAEAGENFDVITYEKGGAVLRMLEGFLGEDVFREGIRRYMVKHARANAEAADLWNALAEASGQPILDWAQAWVGNGGFPLVSVSAKGRELTLSQTRFYSRPGLRTDDLWPVPLWVRYEDDAGTHEAKVQLTTHSRQLTLPGKGALRYVCANVDNRGFFRVAYAPDLLEALCAHREALRPSEKISLLSDAWALLRADQAPIEGFFSLAETFSQETDYAVLDELVSRLSVVSHRLLGEADRPRFEAWVQRCFGEAFGNLGWDARAGETDEVALQRAAVVRALGLLGKDRKILAEAHARVSRLLQGDAGALPADLLDVACVLAAQEDDGRLFEAFQEAYAQAVDPAAKRRFLNALTAFEEKAALEKAQRLLFTEKVPMQEVGSYVFGLLANPRGRPSFWATMQARWPEVLARTGGGQGLLKRVVESIGQLTTRPELEEAQRLFSTQPVEAAQKAMEQTLERLSQEVAFRERVWAAVSRRLASSS